MWVIISASKNSTCYHKASTCDSCLFLHIHICRARLLKQVAYRDYRIHCEIYLHDQFVTIRLFMQWLFQGTEQKNNEQRSTYTCTHSSIHNVIPQWIGPIPCQTITIFIPWHRHLWTRLLPSSYNTERYFPYKAYISSGILRPLNLSNVIAGINSLCGFMPTKLQTINPNY